MVLSDVSLGQVIWTIVFLVMLAAFVWLFILALRLPCPRPRAVGMGESRMAGGADHLPVVRIARVPARAGAGG